MNRLKGKIAVITGGNSGVGAATAKLFAAEGATVVITARREAALKEVADEITAAGGEVYAVCLIRCECSWCYWGRIPSCGSEANGGGSD